MHRFASALAGLPLLFSLALCPVSAHADQVLYNEASQGDLPSLPSFHDVGTTVVGNNYVIGAVIHDEDAFTFTVPTGQLLTELIVNSTTSNSTANLYFGPGASIGNDNTSSYIGNTINLNLLDGAHGSKGPFGPGLYNSVVDGFSSEVNDYQLDFVTVSTMPPTVTPEPASLVLLSTGLLGMSGVLRKRVA